METTEKLIAKDQAAVKDEKLGDGEQYG